MRETLTTVATLAITILLVALTVTALMRGREVAALEDQIATLERQIQARQIMLNDAHRLIPALEHRVVKIQTDLSPREAIWTLAEALAEQGCEVQIH